MSRERYNLIINTFISDMKTGLLGTRAEVPLTHFKVYKLIEKINKAFV